MRISDWSSDVCSSDLWAPRWVATLWPVSVIGALALGAATTSAAMPLVSREGDIAQVDTLSVDPDFVWPENFLGPSNGAYGYEDFFGLTAMTTAEGRSAARRVGKEVVSTGRYRGAAEP